MNKKFSTLLAGVTLFSAMSANAAPASSNVDNTIKLKEGKNSELFQLALGTDGADGYLTIVNGKLKVITSAEALKSENLASALWCVEVATYDQGQHPKFEFLNKGAQAYLDIASEYLTGKAEDTAITTTTDSIEVGGDLGGWAFSKVFAAGVEQERPLYTHFSTDSVVGLAYESTSSEKLVLKKYAASKTGLDDQFVKVTLKRAGVLTLAANEINTVIGTQKGTEGVDLTFAPDVVGTDLKNPFKEGKFLAAASDESDYVYVLSKDSSYLYVDTAYTNAVGTAKFLKYSWSDLKYATIQKSKAATKPTSAADSIAQTYLKDQFKFKFIYHPSQDSLEILVKSVGYLKAGKNYFTNTTDTIQKEDVHVSLQELIKGKTRILTVDTIAQNTKIGFNFKGCEIAASDKTSEDNGLYIITNAEGKVLASPIHRNGGAYEWVTMDEQEAKHMPAFQWLVWKTQTATTLQPTSPLMITNREYEGSAKVQLRKDKDGKTIADAFTVTKGNVSFSVADGSAIKFTQIKEEAILKDKYLGYKKFDKDSLTVTKYKFNYLHPFSQSKWIERGTDKDSVLYAKDGYTAFSISEGTEVQYGAKAGDKIKDLADLYRTQYLITLGADTLGANAEKKVVIGKFATLDSVYFKENNHHNDNHYYAIVNASKNAIANDAMKVGVADDGLTANLKSQPLAETRTSAFAIAVDDIPLYRRFNKAILNEKADDAADTLRFVEKVRHEYLMDEKNPNLLNKVVDYAGIWTSDKSAGLAFHVDTAWVNRGLGFIKPQYLISVDRHEVAAIDTIPCAEKDNHYYFDENDKPVKTDDPKKCVHAKPGKPGYNIAKYLVSFADSAYKYKDAKEVLYTDVKGGYVRVGFVKAIQEGDSLYFLVNGFENKANNDLSVAEVVAAYKKAGIYKDYVKPLTGDEHKNYTWSFRYVSPENAASVEKEGTANEFLIESMAYTEKEGKFDAKGEKKNITPNVAAWLKMQNGCLVLTDTNSTFGNAKTGGDGALVFNVKNIDNDELATDNETISTTGVSVIAGEGLVTIAGAAGKKVVITNILGQVVANTVIASDNAPIAAPAGVVVVAVEGEAAVKAIVK